MSLKTKMMGLVFLAFAMAIALVEKVQALELQPRGRIHIDYAAHQEDLRELGDGFRMRRARLGLSGRIDDNWQFLIEYDFAENTANANDVFLRYLSSNHGQFTVGHFKVPFSLDELIGSNAMPFIERALPTTTFAQARRMGIGYDLGLERWTVSVMAFGQGSGSGVRSSSGDEGLGIGGRLTFNPIDSERHLVHLGLAASVEQPEDSNANTVRFRTRPESRPTDLRLVDTQNIDRVDRIAQNGIEAAWRSGAYSLQAEWMRSALRRDQAAANLDFSGWYLAASWVLTGESRAYRNGVFGGITPEGPRGAWELVVRYSRVDLDDAEILGGQQINRTLGLNWYANRRVRLMLNLIDVKSSRAGLDDDPGIVLMRAQVAF